MRPKLPRIRKKWLIALGSLLLIVCLLLGNVISKQFLILIGQRSEDNPYGHFEKINGPNLYRRHHSMHLLPDGKVLIAGGQDFRKGSDHTKNAVLQAEVYDPKTRSFSLVGKMREFHYCSSQGDAGCGIMLPDGRVLFLGYPGKHIEVYNPSLKAFQQFSDFEFKYTISMGSILLLDNEKLLLIGGLLHDGFDVIRDVNLFFLINIMKNTVISKINNISNKSPLTSHIFPVRQNNKIIIISPKVSFRHVNDRDLSDISNSFVYNVNNDDISSYKEIIYIENIAKLVFSKETSCFGMDNTYAINDFTSHCHLLADRYDFYSEGGRTPVFDWIAYWLRYRRFAYLYDLTTHKAIELPHPLTRAFSENNHVILSKTTVLGVSGEDAELFIQ